MSIDLAQHLREINTATKYPSIPTYHTMKGGLLQEFESLVFPPSKSVIGTKKANGCSTRIVLFSDGMYLIGSRDQLLYASGDIVSNPNLGIVDALRDMADALSDSLGYFDGGGAVVVYGELFGGKIGGEWKNYTADPDQFAFRVFDVADFTDLDQLVTKYSLEHLAGMRDRNEIQSWFFEHELVEFAEENDLELTPRLFETDEMLPNTLQETMDLLSHYPPETKLKLSDSAFGRSEGIVFRTTDRRVIAKARFEDYEKALKKQNPHKPQLSKHLSRTSETK